jgi:hypothetical protein
MQLVGWSFTTQRPPEGASSSAASAGTDGRCMAATEVSPSGTAGWSEVALTGLPIRAPCASSSHRGGALAWDEDGLFMTCTSEVSETRRLPRASSLRVDVRRAR